MNEKIIKILLDEHIITAEKLSQAREEQSKSGDSLEVVLSRLGIPEQKIISFLSEKFRVPVVDWSHAQINSEVLDTVPEEKARKYRVFPLAIERTERRQGKITLAMADPSDFATINEIAFMTGCSVRPMVASESSILEAIRQYYGAEEAGVEPLRLQGEDSSTKSEEKKSGASLVSTGERTSPIKGLEELRSLAKDLIASVEYVEEKEDTVPPGLETQSDKWLTHILTQAIKRGASDIHLDSYEKGLAVHYRIDNMLYGVEEPPSGLKRAILSALKQRGQITTPTERIPYQGDLTIKLDSKEKVEFLISIYPSFYGEKITLKFKNKASHLPGIAQLGFEENTLKMFLKPLDTPDGLILITSPISGGKTTTFYAALRYLNKPHLNILTLEKSVESSLEGINQAYLENSGTFKEKVSTLMEYDPDIFGIDEISNTEEARTALDLSSQTLVLATLTAPDTSSALLQFLSLLETPEERKARMEGLPSPTLLPRSSMLALDSINCITSQRLVRQICPVCKEELKHSSEILDLLAQMLIQMGLSEKEANMFSLYKGRGCVECNQTGYKGLIGLFEVMRVTREIRDAVLTEPLTGNLRTVLRDLKMMTLARSGLQKIKAGMTSLEEVKRVLAL